MRILIITLLIHLNVIHTGARDWRGIVPLRTTRLEVIRLLGQPKRSQTTKIEYFDLGDKEVTINWIDPTCQKQYPIEADVTVRPEDLVLNISVFPREPIPLKDFNLLPM